MPTDQSRAKTGVIWNVWDRGRLLGIVNEPTKTWAADSARLKWPGRASLRVVEARRDPFRLATLVRAIMLAYPGVLH